MVGLAARLKQTTYEHALGHLPMQKKLQRGRKPNTRPALIRQSIEPVQPNTPRTVEYNEVEESQEQVASESTKRGRRPNAAKVATPQNPSRLKKVLYKIK